jgi:hypothetical protein
LKVEEEKLLERMNNDELEDEDEIAKNSKTKNNEREHEKMLKQQKGMKKIPLNHRSADDMDFEDPEYLQERNRQMIKNKRNNQVEQDDNKKVEENTDDEEEEDEEEDEADNELATKDIFKDFQADEWLTKFETISTKIKNNLISNSSKEVNSKEINTNLIAFEKFLDTLISNKLDPSKDDKNRKRLCLLTKKLVQFYESLFDVPTKKTKKNSSFQININLIELVVSFIHKLTLKYGNNVQKKSLNKPDEVGGEKDDGLNYISIFKEYIYDLNQCYNEVSIKNKKFPSLKVLMMFKLITTVFPVSDFRHQITTPTLLIMTRYLTEVIFLFYSQI